MIRHNVGHSVGYNKYIYHIARTYNETIKYVLSRNLLNTKCVHANSFSQASYSFILPIIAKYAAHVLYFLYLGSNDN